MTCSSMERMLPWQQNASGAYTYSETAWAGETDHAVAVAKTRQSLLRAVAYACMTVAYACC